MSVQSAPFRLEDGGDMNPDEACVHFSDEERNAGIPSPEKTSQALLLFQKYGFVRLENVFHPDFLSRLIAHYNERYKMYLEGTYKADLRPLFTVDVEGAFNDPSFYANPIVMPFFKKCLGEDCIVGAMSSVVSFPGAPDQFVHRDSQAIFGDDYEVDQHVPPYAMTMLIPFVDCTTETGCTKVWPGSHRRNVPNAVETEKTPPFEPEVKVGSVLITNSKVVHRGGANRSQRLRPLVYLTYHRKWFRDFWGYETRPPVNVSALQLRRIPDEYKHMFAWTKDAYATIRIRNAAKRMLPFSVVRAVRSLVRKSGTVG